jgi:DtxR family manganese transport transcriptional regulator
MMRRLQEARLVTQEPYRDIAWTPEGRALAERGRRKHRIVEGFLLAIGVSDEKARIDAEGMEHHVSDETLDAMERFLDRRR